MRKLKYLSLLSIFGIAGFNLFANPSLARYPYPEVNQSVKYEPVCFIKIREGKVLDLSSICGKGAQNTTLTSHPKVEPTPYIDELKYIPVITTPTPPPSNF